MSRLSKRQLAHISAILMVAVHVAACSPADDTTATATSAQSISSPVISQVRTDLAMIDPASGESVTIKFHLDASADVTLSVHDGRNRVVFVEERKGLPSGDHAIEWNGLTTKGTAVPAEAYGYTLTARGAEGVSTHDVSDLTGSQRIEARDVRWDSEAGVIRYYLDKPARVNLRIGIDEGPYLRTVVDWVARPAGEQAEAWDGQDASGVLDLSATPGIRPVVAAYTLPDNTIFVGPLSGELSFVAEKDALAVRTVTTTARKEIAKSTQQPLDTRGDVEAKLVPVGDFRQDDEGRWVVSGVVPFRVDVSDKDRDRVVQRRFESVFYVDGVFTYENELGYLPMTWKWDTGKFNPGEHFVTLNIRGYEGNFGAATVKVLIERSDSAAQNLGKEK